MTDEELVKSIEWRLLDVLDMLEKLDFTTTENKRRVESMVCDVSDLVNNLTIIEEE